MIKGASATIYVSDLDQSVSFHKKTLGVDLLIMAPSHFAMLKARNGFCWGLHPASEQLPESGSAGSIQIGFSVEASLEETIGKLRKSGVNFSEEIASDGGNIRTIGFQDPDGNPLYLVEEEA